MQQRYCVPKQYFAGGHGWPLIIILRIDDAYAFFDIAIYDFALSFTAYRQCLSQGATAIPCLSVYIYAFRDDYAAFAFRAWCAELLTASEICAGQWPIPPRRRRYGFLKPHYLAPLSMPITDGFLGMADISR